eukprot:TRINITY_DN7370_c0_g2_i3.p1 TRINITY_DN7370_c0_g2~~TRINITY_DN7370_c0_g2_i3.p1  ORF type:complete len:686 (+),score=60.43 TRINITY_DN7370_c0_g2_i3:386-2443(+)
MAPPPDAYAKRSGLRSVCAKGLVSSLERAFGVPVAPEEDSWYTTALNPLAAERWGVSQSVAVAAGVVLIVSLGRRRTGAVGATLSDTLVVPSSCLRSPPAANASVAVPFAQTAARAVKLTGELASGFYDGALESGGWSGMFVAPPGAVWSGSAAGNVIRKVLLSAFGVPNGEDTVYDVVDGCCVVFMLAPRRDVHMFECRAQKPFRDANFADALWPQADGPVLCEDSIPFERFHSPSAVSTLDTPIRTEDLEHGSTRFSIHLKYGYEFSAAASPCIRDALQAAFGPSDEDVVEHVSSTTANVVLGQRRRVGAAVVRMKLSSRCVRTVGCGRELSISAADVGVSPAAVIVGSGRAVFKWAVVGGGPNGMHAIARMAERWAGSEEKLLWLDEAGFGSGRLKNYVTVSSMNTCTDFASLFGGLPALGGSVWHAVKVLHSMGGHPHCKLGYAKSTVDAGTHFLRTRVASLRVRVSELTKVGTGDSFEWLLRMNGHPDISVTGGVVLATGGVPRTLAGTIPCDIAMSPVSLAASVHAADPHKEHHTVTVVGSGPSAAVALWHLARLPRVRHCNVVYKRRNAYTQVLPTRPDGRALKVSQVRYGTPEETAVLNSSDSVILCTGWTVSDVPMKSPREPRSSLNVSAGPKLWHLGPWSNGGDRANLLFLTSLKGPITQAVRCGNPSQCMGSAQ